MSYTVCHSSSVIRFLIISAVKSSSRISRPPNWNRCTFIIHQSKNYVILYKRKPFLPNSVNRSRYKLKTHTNWKRVLTLIKQCKTSVKFPAKHHPKATNSHNYNMLINDAFCFIWFRLIVESQSSKYLHQLQVDQISFTPSFVSVTYATWLARHFKTNHVSVTYATWLARHFKTNHVSVTYATWLARHFKTNHVSVTYASWLARHFKTNHVSVTYATWLARHFKTNHVSVTYATWLARHFKTNHLLTDWTATPTQDSHKFSDLPHVLQRASLCRQGRPCGRSGRGHQAPSGPAPHRTRTHHHHLSLSLSFQPWHLNKRQTDNSDNPGTRTRGKQDNSDNPGTWTRGKRAILIILAPEQEANKTILIILAPEQEANTILIILAPEQEANKTILIILAPEQEASGQFW